MVRVKICGLTRIEDAELAIELGADALGFVFEPTSPRFLAPDRRSLIRGIEPYALCVAVYGSASTLDPSGCNAIQLIDIAPGTGVSHPQFCPPLFKVVRPTSGDPTVAKWQAGEWVYAHSSYRTKALVLDAFDEKELGGTGKRVDWDFAREFVALSDLPVILAGGLTPDNVAEAIRIVRPYAVDVSSGVEVSPGIKDAAKMRDFIQAAKSF